jgi:FkbM family methyltransferase
MGVLGSAVRAYLGWPDHPAKLRLVRLLARTVVPASGYVTLVHPGLRMFLHPRDWLEYVTIQSKSYEPRTLDFIQANIQPGDAAVFAGVNFGLHVMVAASAAGVQGRVIGVEPQPGSLIRASENIRLNALPENITLAAVALGARRGFVQMPRPPEWNSGAASLLDTERPGFICVPLIPFDDLVAELGLGKVRIFLLDVEGYELRVLEGMKEVLPEVLVVEATDHTLRRDGKTIADLISRMRSLGYSIFDLFGNPFGEGSVVLENNVVGLRGDIDSISWVH